MTLGKIERFWSTIWQDFLVRAQFDSFEAARERIKLWIKHYNHKRPNQGIDGLCPADRFFEIQSELRKTIDLKHTKPSSPTSKGTRGRCLPEPLSMPSSSRTTSTDRFGRACWQPSRRVAG